jgi:dsRNA-specific ribonuclease
VLPVLTCRVTVSGDPQRGIVGVGDHANKKEAEKLAALSAVLQLASAGLVCPMCYGSR